LRALSSAALIWLAASVSAHEVVPTIADLRIADDNIVIDLRANVESFVSGIDLTAIVNTDTAEQSADYDRLRALDPAALETALREFWPQMAQMITLRADDTPLAVALGAVQVDPVGDVELPRVSQLQITAALPAGASTVEFGWTANLGAVVLRQMDVPEPFDGYLDNGATSGPIAIAGGDQASGWQTFAAYIPVGVDHIVPKGLDHILFVLGLFFLAARAGPLLLQVSLFTLAHTITLALAALGYVTISGAIVEPLIAASIVFIAVENIFTKQVSRWRPYVIFGFGLLHGLGFASVLAEFGLPEASFVAALIGFNVGVELGQLLVILVMFLCVWQAIRVDRGANEVTQSYVIYGVLFVLAAGLSVLNPVGLQTALENPVWVFGAPLAAIFALCALSVALRDQIDAYRRLVTIPASAAIAFVGAFWVVERVFF
jgi:hypothetical protein